MKLIVEGMTCAHCVRTLTAAIHQLDASARVDVDLPAETVRIAGAVDAAAAVDAIREAGYAVVAVLEEEEAAPERAGANACCGSCHA